jgi:hypothetical protein
MSPGQADAAELAALNPPAPVEPEVFIGYSGPKGREIATEMIQCLEGNGFKAAVPIPGRPEFEAILEDENEIMARALLCQGSVMICNRMKYSRKFLFEVQFLIDESPNPLISLVQDRCHVPPVLSVQRRVKFKAGRHLECCKELVLVLNAKMGRVQLGRESDVLTEVDLPQESGP